MKSMNIAIIGFGNVGRALVKTIALKRKMLIDKYDVSLNVVAIADSRGMVIKPNGLSEYEMLKLCEIPRSCIYMFTPYAKQVVDLDEIYNETQPQIHVELTPANYVTGEPGYRNVLFALRRGAHVVTANKAPLALHYREVVEEAKARGCSVEFTATVMGGTPFLRALISMRSHDIEKVEGILNATTNYILTEMHENLLDFEQALKKAQTIGVAEKDPSLDVEGFDAAAKLTIISNVVGKPVNMNEIYRESIINVSQRDIMYAIKQNYVIKHVAKLDVQRGVASVKVEKVPKNSLLAHVNGTLNCAIIKSDVTELSFIGSGGGRLETAHTVLDDVLKVALR
jgi:homoserine dehydrogenase